MIVPQQPSWQLAVSRRLGLVCASLALIVLVAQASPPSEVSDASEQLEEWVPSCYPFCGMEVVVHKGYGLERHYATTPDGYILIPYFPFRTRVRHCSTNCMRGTPPAQSLCALV